MPIPPPLSRQEFKITIICALTLEAKAVLPLFDTKYDANSDEYRKVPGDTNSYTLGSVGRYHVVLTHMPGVGKGYASSVASNVRRSYPCVELALVVGVCGGVPFVEDSMALHRDIFLGDVIVSKGVVQYDLGHQAPDAFKRKDKPLDNLARPCPEILAFLNKLDVGYDQLTDRLASYLVKVQKNSRFRSEYPGLEKDILLSPEYHHRETDCKCTDPACNDDAIIVRRRDATQDQGKPLVHFGLVGSGDTVMKSPQDRDRISGREKIIGFEMEGAGVWDNLPCIVIKGVSDYADSHKTKEWQHFAAASAAACMRAVLDEMPVSLPIPVNSHERSTEAYSKKRTAAEMSESSQAEEEFYLEALTFPRAELRFEEITSALEKTCEWIVGHAEYLRWMSEEELSSHGGFFWIKGKPGAGKSTMMKYLLLKSRKTLKDTVILSFFFYAQGMILERSVMGMYRSLLHQLLLSEETSPDCRKRFLSLAKSLELHEGKVAWTKRDVKSLLSLTMKRFEGRQILVLIDAVDECDQEEVKDMTTFFQELGNSALIHKVNLRICLASRHYPHITLEKGIEFIIENQQEHEDDIEKYVKTKLRLGRFKEAQEIRQIICGRAAGVFLWVMLAVRSLNEAFDKGDIDALKERLDQIPDELDDLFTDILTRNQEDKEALIFSLQLILFGRRRLKREEFYFALLFEKSGSIEEDIDWELHSKKVMSRRILDVTKGLAESARIKPYRVRFIHESVRDFLLQRNGLAKILSEQIDPSVFVGRSHSRLADICFRYFLRVNHPSFRYEIELLEGYRRQAEKDDHIQATYPFLDYAVKSLLEHINFSQADQISQKNLWQEFVNQFSNYKRIYNSVERSATRQYSGGQPLLDVLVEKDFHHLIPLAYQACTSGMKPTLDLKVPARQTLMGTAISKGHLGSIRALLGLEMNRSSSVIRNSTDPELVSGMRIFLSTDSSERDSPEVVRLVLNLALESRHVQILRLLLLTGVVDFNCTDGPFWMIPLVWACENSDPAIVEFLLYEAMVDVNGHPPASLKHGIHPLKMAFFSKKSKSSDPSQIAAYRNVLDILLGHDCLNLHYQDEDGRNAIHWAVMVNDAVSLKHLINRGADYEHQDSDGRDPLSYTAERGTMEVLTTLLAADAIDVDKQDNKGRTPFWWAIHHEQKDIVEILLGLDRLDVNSRDLNGWTPLTLTINHKQKDIVEILLGCNRVDVNSSNANGWTPLSLAINHMQKDILEILLGLDRLDVNSRDPHGRTPLAMAVHRKRKDIVEMLLRCGRADVNSRNLYGWTPLTMAVLYKQKDIVEILLGCDQVDTNAQDDNGRTALSWATGPFASCKAPVENILHPLCHFSNDETRADILHMLMTHTSRPDLTLVDNWGHSMLWWAQAYQLILRASDILCHTGELSASFLDIFSSECASRGISPFYADPGSVEEELRSLSRVGSCISIPGSQLNNPGTLLGPVCLGDYSGYDGWWCFEPPT